MSINERTKIDDLLQELVKLDYDAIEAYDAAIERLDNHAFKNQLSKYCDDHRRHTQNLGAELRKLGAEVPDGPDMKRFLTEGKVVIAGLGGDKAVLTAMRANEEVTNKTYEKAVEHADAGPEIRAILEQNLADERRHRAWLKQTIDTL